METKQNKKILVSIWGHVPRTTIVLYSVLKVCYISRVILESDPQQVLQKVNYKVIIRFCGNIPNCHTVCPYGI